MTAKKTRRSRRRFLFGLGAVGLSLGGAAAYLNWRRSAAYPGPIGKPEDLRHAEPFDVCIIGSGPAGAVLGLDLVRRGLRILILESGPDLWTTVADARLKLIHQSTNAGSIAYPGDVSRMRGLGGTSNIWTGRCDRLHPIDFTANAYTSDKARWPISYAHLQPYYSQAEQTLRVRGGRMSAFGPPRDNDLPLPADADISGLKNLLQDVGIVLDDSPTSTSPNGGGPVRAAQDLLPTFTVQSGASLIGGATVTSLLADASGRIIGAEVRDLDRQLHTVKARVFVISAGAIESPRLLLLSRSERFSEGLGNTYGQVGRFFNEHPNLNFQGMITDDGDALASAHELGRCHQYYDEFKRRGLGSVLLVFARSRESDNQNRTGAMAKLRIGATMEMEPMASNRVSLSAHLRDYFGNPVPEIHLNFSERDQKTMTAVRELIGNIYARLGASDVQEMDLTWSHHHIGTCRMGDNPRSSVTDANLRVHGCPNLYVLSSASFVTGGASHPTLVIVALAHRLARHLHEGFISGVFPAAVKKTSIRA